MSMAVPPLMIAIVMALIGELVSPHSGFIRGKPTKHASVAVQLGRGIATQVKISALDPCSRSLGRR